MITYKVIITALVKIYSTEYFCNVKAHNVHVHVHVGKIFVQQVCTVLYFLLRLGLVVTWTLEPVLRPLKQLTRPGTSAYRLSVGTQLAMTICMPLVSDYLLLSFFYR